MKLVNKIKLVLFPTAIFPMILMLVGIVVIFTEYLEFVYNGDAEMQMLHLVSSHRIVDSVIHDIFVEIKETAAANPDAFNSISYLENLNERLEDTTSFILVRKNGKIVFRGTEQREDFSDIEELLPAYGTTNKWKSGGFYIGSPKSVLIKQQDFLDKDKKECSVFILTNLNDLFPHTGQIIIRISIIVIFILILTNSIFTIFIYRAFINPIYSLRKQTDKIKNGNLETEIRIRNKDELGELSRSLDEMRVRLKNLIDEREQSEEELRVLVSHISHDLRTPLTAIRGYTEGIRDGVADTPEKLEKYMTVIYHKTKEMQILVNELILYTQISSNNVIYHFRNVRVNEYFQEYIDFIKLDLDQEHTKLYYRNKCAEYTKIRIDTEQMKRVLNNIIINAVKYNDKEEGNLEIYLREEGEFVKIEIKDNGKGIEEEILSKIFERFYRAETSRNSKTGGSGLGLSIAKKIVEEHGGEIWASSELGTWTVIHLKLKKLDGGE